MKKFQSIKDLKESKKLKQFKSNFDLSHYSKKEKIVLGKYISAVVVMFIVACYAVNFAMDSRNYSTIKSNDEILNSDYIYNGVYIAETFIGGLTKDQAVEVGNSGYVKPRLEGFEVTFQTEYGYEKTYKFGELGAKYDIESAVDEAYKFNRSGNRTDRLNMIDEVKTRGEHINPDYSFDENVLRDVANEMAEEADKEYSLVGEKADADRLYDILYKNMQIQQHDNNIFIPKKQS